MTWREVELHRGLAPEDVDQHLDLELVFVDFGHVTRERRKRTGLDLHRVVDLELVGGHAALGNGLLDAFDVGADDVVDLATRERRRLGLFGADESGHARRRADHVEDLGVWLAANEQVAREHALGDGDLLARLELGDVLFGQVDLVDRVAQLAALDDVVERADDLLLVSGEGVHDVPATRSVKGALDDWLFVLVDDRDVEDLLAVSDVVRRFLGGWSLRHSCSPT